jgi:hypothetical protein
MYLHIKLNLFKPNFMNDIENIETKVKSKLPFIVRWLIILGSCILIILIWLCMIPFWIFVTIPTGRLMHEFDFVTEPYYWVVMCYRNEKMY